MQTRARDPIPTRFRVVVEGSYGDDERMGEFGQLWSHVRLNEIDEARQLLESGEAPDERSGNRMLGRALHHSSFEMAQLLIDFGVNVNYKNSSGHSLLHKVTWVILPRPSKDPEVQAETKHRDERTRSKVALLVKAGADVLLTDKEGWNVLHKAAYMGHVRVVQWLLEDADKLAYEDIGVDIFAKTDAGETAQQLAKLNAHHRASATAPHHKSWRCWRLRRASPSAWLSPWDFTRGWG